MVTLQLGPRDLANVRFAFSPLWECVAAFRAWRDPSRHALHLPWAAAVDPGVRRHNWALLDCVARPPSGAIPDFLAPPPATPLARFDDELAAARRTPRGVVRRELAAAYPGGLPTELAGEKPEVVLEGATALLDTFWRLAVAPAWPRIAARLEAEVAFRARALALGGPPALFDGLHPTVRYGPLRAERHKRAERTRHHGTLRVAARETYTRMCRGAGLLLVPSVFSWPDVFVAARPPWHPTLAYPARGVAELWDAPLGRNKPGDYDNELPTDPRPIPALAALLGVARARVLTRLVTPQTTAELAAGLGLAPATASAHLTALWRAGVAERSRVGRRVFYALSARGRAVLHALGIED